MACSRRRTRSGRARTSSKAGKAGRRRAVEAGPAGAPEGPDERGDSTDYIAQLKAKDGNVAALVKAEPWLFDAGAPGKGSATSLEPAGTSGGSDDQYMRRWERIAGLADEGKDG